MINRNLFSVSTADNSELDLRQEFDNLIFGTDGSVPKGKLAVVRHMRRDSLGKKVACPCKQPNTGEAEPNCSYCGGEAYLWDESWYMCREQYIGADGGLGSKYRFTPAGEVRADTKVFFFRYDVAIKYGDKIVEMLLDIEGKPVIPYVREAIYKPQTIRAYRGDNGRIEYIAVYCLEKDALRPDVFR